MMVNRYLNHLALTFDISDVWICHDQGDGWGSLL